MRNHHIFKHFTIVNVAGDGDEEIDTSNALQAVKSAMTSNPENTYTITLSCGRLTTGVSVPEWTAVLMLAGSYSTAASYRQYLEFKHQLISMVKLRKNAMFLILHQIGL